MKMKNAIRVLSLIALTGTALAAASNASFAATHRAHPVRKKVVAMKHKKSPKKVVINLERGKGHKARKPGAKPGINEPGIVQA